LIEFQTDTYPFNEPSSEADKEVVIGEH